MPENVAQPTRNLVLAFFVVLIVGTMFNVIIELGRSDSDAALRPSDSSQLLDLAQRDEPSLAVKVGFAATLRAIGQGGVLIVPPDAGIQEMQVVYIAGMTMVVEDYDATIDERSVLSLANVESISSVGKVNFNSDEHFTYFVIWRGDAPAEALRFLESEDGTILVVEERLVQELAR